MGFFLVSTPIIPILILSKQYYPSPLILILTNQLEFNLLYFPSYIWIQKSKKKNLTFVIGLVLYIINFNPKRLAFAGRKISHFLLLKSINFSPPQIMVSSLTL